MFTCLRGGFLSRCQSASDLFGLLRFLSESVLVTFLVAVTKCPDNGSAGKNGFIVTHSLRLVHLLGTSLQQGLEVAGHSPA